MLYKYIVYILYRYIDASLQLFRTQFPSFIKPFLILSPQAQHFIKNKSRSYFILKLNILDSILSVIWSSLLSPNVLELHFNTNYIIYLHLNFV